MTAKSCSGWIIQYAGCPITWASKLQTLTALLTMDAKYVALSMAMRQQLPLINLLKEIVSHNVDASLQRTTIHCKAFQDNSGALEMAKVPKMRPRTKHLNNMYHHFRESVQNNEVTLIAVKTENQLADLLTKPLPEDLFLQFWDQVLQSTPSDKKGLGGSVTILQYYYKRPQPSSAQQHKSTLTHTCIIPNLMSRHQPMLTSSYRHNHLT